MESVSLKSQKLLFLACRILGVLPCDRDLHISRFGIFYSIVANLLLCGWVFYIKHSPDLWDSERASGNFIVELMVVIRELSDFLVTGAQACSLLLRRKTLKKITAGIEFLELSATSGDVSRKVFHVVFIICNSIILLIAGKLCPPLYFHSKMNKIEMELPYMISFFAATSFSVLIDYLRSHLDRMTKNLNTTGKKLGLQLDLTLFILDLSRSINKFYSMQIFLLCCRVLINIILSGYFVVDSFRTNYLFTTSDAVWIDCLVCLALVVGFAGDLFALIWVCSSCTNFRIAVESFNDALFCLMRKNKDLCNNDKLFLFITIKQRVQFTACSFYSLGYPLVTSIIATATTHLVILVQFTSPD